MRRKTKNLFDSLEDLLEIKIKRKSIFPNWDETVNYYMNNPYHWNISASSYSNLTSEHIDAGQPIYYTTYATTDSYSAHNHNIAANWNTASDGLYYNSVNTGDMNVRN